MPTAVATWAAVMCLSGALQAARPDASLPWDALRGLLGPGEGGRPWPRAAPRPSSWPRRGPRLAVEKRREELPSATEELPADRGRHPQEVLKKAISLWVTLHPLTPVPSGRPPASRKHAPANGRRPYGRRLRWGR